MIGDKVRSIYKNHMTKVLNRMVNLSYSIPYVEFECRLDYVIRDTKGNEALYIHSIVSENKIDLTVHPKQPFYTDLFDRIIDTSKLHNRTQDMFVLNLSREIATHFSLNLE